MTKEDFLFLMNDTPETDESFVDSFLFSGGGGGARPAYLWDFTKPNPLVDKIEGKVATKTGDVTFSSDGAFFSGSDQYIELPSDVKGKNLIYVFDLGTFTNVSNSHHAMIFTYNNSSQGLGWLLVSGYWAMRAGSSWENMGIGNNPIYFSDSILKIVWNNSGKWEIYKDDVLIYTTNNTMSTPSENANMRIGQSGYTFNSMYIKSLKVYRME